MALNLVTTGNVVLAADINQLVQVLQRSAGQTETGKYVLAWAGYTNGATGSLYQDSLSRVSTPVSVTIDTADVSPGGSANSPSTGHLTAGGFQVFSSTTAASVNAFEGGNYTIQY